MLAGNYEGTFTKDCADCTTETSRVKINFDNSQFSGETDNGHKLPAIGKGVYTIDRSKIDFNNASFWTADFDWRLILKGEYRYELAGDVLRLEKAEDGYTYVYLLTKQK